MSEVYKGYELNTVGDSNWGGREASINKSFIDNIKRFDSTDSFGIGKRTMVVANGSTKTLLPVINIASGKISGVATVYNPSINLCDFSSVNSVNDWIFGAGITREFVNHEGEQCLKLTIPSGFVGVIAEWVFGPKPYNIQDPYRLYHFFKTESESSHTISFGIYSITQTSYRVLHNSGASTDPVWFNYTGKFNSYEEPVGETFSYRVSTDTPLVGEVIVYLSKVELCDNRDSTGNGSFHYFEIDLFNGSPVAPVTVKGSTGYFETKPPTIGSNIIPHATGTKDLKVDLRYDLFT